MSPWLNTVAQILHAPVHVGTYTAHECNYKLQLRTVQAQVQFAVWTIYSNSFWTCTANQRGINLPIPPIPCRCEKAQLVYFATRYCILEGSHGIHPLLPWDEYRLNCGCNCGQCPPLFLRPSCSASSPYISSRRPATFLNRVRIATDLLIARKSCTSRRVIALFLSPQEVSR